MYLVVKLCMDYSIAQISNIVTEFELKLNIPNYEIKREIHILEKTIQIHLNEELTKNEITDSCFNWVKQVKLLILSQYIFKQKDIKII